MYITFRRKKSLSFFFFSQAQFHSLETLVTAREKFERSEDSQTKKIVAWQTKGSVVEIYARMHSQPWIVSRDRPTDRWPAITITLIQIYIVIRDRPGDGAPFKSSRYRPAAERHGGTCIYHFTGSPDRGGNEESIVSVGGESPHRGKKITVEKRTNIQQKYIWILQEWVKRIISVSYRIICLIRVMSQFNEIKSLTRVSFCKCNTYVFQHRRRNWRSFIAHS